MAISLENRRQRKPNRRPARRRTGTVRRLSLEALEPRQLLAGAGSPILPDALADGAAWTRDAAERFYSALPAPAGESATPRDVAGARATTAGNVQVSLKDGNLVLAGNNKRASIVITQDAVGTYRVTGQDGTTINGESSPAVVQANGIQLTMGAAGDSVRLENMSVRGGLSISSGAGSDHVSVDNIEVLGSFSIVTGRGADVVLGSRFDVYGNLAVTAGDGTDVVCFDQFHVDRTYSVAGDGGKDILATLLGNVGEDTTIYLGSGNDAVSVAHLLGGGSLAVSGQAGRDVMQLLGVEMGGTVTVSGGAGMDDISVQDGTSAQVTTALYQATYLTTELRDYLLVRMFAVNAVYSVRAPAFRVNAGSGHDVATLNQLTVSGRLDVAMGDGWDTLMFSDNSYASAALDGGKDTGIGLDQLVTDQPQSSSLTWRGFERAGMYDF